MKAPAVMPPQQNSFIVRVEIYQWHYYHYGLITLLWMRMKIYESYNLGVLFKNGNVVENIQTTLQQNNGY